jgi:hypothetical protein
MLVWSVAAALAQEAPPPAGCEGCLYDEIVAAPEDPPRAPRDFTLSGDLASTRIGDTPGVWGSIDLADGHHHRLRVEGRADAEGRLMRRGSLTFDLFPRHGFDLNLGLYAGNAATWATRERNVFQVGTEVSTTLRFGDWSVGARWLGGPDAEEQIFRRETLWDLTWQVVGPVRVSVQGLSLIRGPQQRESGFALGAGLSF